MEKSKTNSELYVHEPWEAWYKRAVSEIGEEVKELETKENPAPGLPRRGARVSKYSELRSGQKVIYWNPKSANKRTREGVVLTIDLDVPALFSGIDYGTVSVWTRGWSTEDPSIGSFHIVAHMYYIEEEENEFGVVSP